MNIQYKAQESRDGIAQAFLIGEDFIDGDRVALILADSIFYGSGFDQNLSEAIMRKKGATVFGYQVKHPESYAVIDFDASTKKVSDIEGEALQGGPYQLRGHRPARRRREGRRVRQDAQALRARRARDHGPRPDLPRTTSSSTPRRFPRASPGSARARSMTCSTQASSCALSSSPRARNIASIEEIAYRKGWIGRAQLLSLASKIQKTEYGKYPRGNRPLDGRAQVVCPTSRSIYAYEEAPPRFA